MWRARRHGRRRLDAPRLDRRRGMHTLSMAARSHRRTRRLVRLRRGELVAMAAGDSMRLVWIDGAGCTPSPWPLAATGALVALSASASSWMCALSMAAAARVRQSPWPSCNRPRGRRVRAGTEGICWN
ncbi:hypothetical protein ACQJBY_064913 [Aegilops geniculata]